MADKEKKPQCENAEEEILENGAEVDVSIEDDEITKLKEELDRQRDLALRTAAEFDNFKKRTEREKYASLEFMKADIVKTFLPFS